ncbi:hypothetical protein [Burkholderia multivorans]|uniref:hypothetical protein n=1 Tax=Burkholderia multivorans TaxID=87883 RepID=UPI0028674E03|nr:hypothetical protein [Burkholderia multivorans]MDR9060748.1 hypothetical protein [Burkholderia multivorans]MDR9084110.1 hypothetical protein [Burkholderia multivorans]MDR9095103.1 hypothetical protein [Burkholderia multivorans]MDR9101539.1 hypothetical protein [Burkholderia multivorans]MDR9106875.1 hypothetical protein [Burkholderia multivorans]
MGNELPPSLADFEAALRRIEDGVTTVTDVQIIRQYVADMEEGMNYLHDRLRETREMLMRERASSDRLERALGEAFNSGSGAYIP